MATDNALHANCQFCHTSVQISDHIYKGGMVPKYKLFLCNICKSANWDGIAPSYEGIFIQHCEEEGIKLPQRNAKGWFPL